MLTWPGVWSDLATEHGLVVDMAPAGSGADLVLRGPHLSATPYEVKVYGRGVRPSVVAELAGRAGRSARLLLLVPVVTPELTKVAHAEGVSVLAPAGEHGVVGVLVDTLGEEHHLDAPVASAALPRPRGRVPWGTYAIAFELLQGPARDHQELADRVGLTRPRVTQVLRTLGPLVHRSGMGWAPREPAALATWLADRYPSAPRLVTTWAVLDPPVVAAEYVARHLEILGLQHAITGDVAADVWAPWARPRAAWIWAESLTDLAQLGATPAAEGVATLTLAVSDDPHLLASAVQAPTGAVALPPWRVWVHLVQHGNDAAATALLESLTR